MKNDTRKTVRGLLIAGVVVMAVSIMWPSLAEKYGASKQTDNRTKTVRDFYQGGACTKLDLSLLNDC